MKGLILFITAYIICVILFPVGILYTILRSLILGGFKYLNKRFLDMAISLDQFGNTFCADLFDITLITDDKYLFGNPDETISSVIGKNKLNNSLSKLGKLLSYILDKLDSNHSVKSIEKDEIYG